MKVEEICQHGLFLQNSSRPNICQEANFVKRPIPDEPILLFQLSPTRSFLTLADLEDQYRCVDESRH